MKKMIRSLIAGILLIALILTSVTASGATKATSKKKINFSGIEWYLDYPTVMKKLKKAGWLEKSEEHFATGEIYARSFLSELTDVIQTDYKDVGGYVRCDVYDRKMTSTAGRVTAVTFYFLWNPEVATGDSEEAKNASRLYLVRAEHQYDGSPVQQLFDQKTQGLLMDLEYEYGEEPRHDTNMNRDYYAWIDEDGGQLGFAARDQMYYYVYCAPKANDRIKEVLKAVK